MATSGRRRETAARLRDAARHVFAEIGYANARVEDIVSLAQVSHGTFYTYYDNKAAVLADLVDTAAARLEQVLAAPWEGPDVRAALERVIGEFLAIHSDEADVMRAWAEAGAVDADFATLRTELRAGFVEKVAANLAPVAEPGGHDPRAAASALVAMVEGYANEHLSGEAPNEIVRTLAAIWYGGLLGLSDTAGTEADA
ncbi:MAG: TetR/AcrR family transcriptional regulator [Actinomycetota bacterium]|nr:TetR/AcrR family transcriptional regulator [Actinomycetota bacterium]